MGPLRHFLLLTLLLLGACSMRGVVENFTSDQDRAFAGEMVKRLRAADEAWLRRHFAAELWARSSAELASVPARFPSEAGRTELIAVNIAVNSVNGRTERNKEFTLATQGGGRWTVTSFRTYSADGPDKVVQWSVVAHSTRPPEVAMFETWDSALPWFWGGMAVTLCGIGGLVFWLVRRSRRRHDPWADRNGPS
jgi:hypothetical protein